MNKPLVNIHATAIVVGTRGLLFTGPSGCGKSTLAFACLAAAKRHGAFAALVADDQVLISCCGDHLIASRPEAIANLIELRGSGIARVESVASIVLDLAIAIVSLPEAERLPPENEGYSIAGMGELPLLRLWNHSPDPLASLAAFMPGFRGEAPF
jgi:serine kinase of HPr protein (carbohydrate metabolism regulator)